MKSPNAHESRNLPQRGTYPLKDINEGFAAMRTGEVARGVIVFD